ncbi:hypothetical protein MICRO80W_270046 [Micrococcus luteus]|nr:hypothetical protein MICRO80W_270046 [Micrococcus luteus]
MMGPRPYARGMRIELARFRVVPGKEERARAWMDFPCATPRRSGRRWSRSACTWRRSSPRWWTG